MKDIVFNIIPSSAVVITPIKTNQTYLHVLHKLRFLIYRLLLTLCCYLFQRHLPIIHQMLHIVELFKNVQIVLMQTHVALQTTFLHKSLLADLALEPFIVVVEFHMIFQGSESRKYFPANIAGASFASRVPRQMIGQSAFRKEFRVAFIAEVTSLLQMMMPYMPVQFELLLVSLAASVARIDDWLCVVLLDQMFASIVVTREDFRTMRAFVPEPAVRVDPFDVIAHFGQRRVGFLAVIAREYALSVRLPVLP